ncbi:MAG: HNH endonuclease, partial [Alphaproteobacteria bacterium]
MISRHLSIPIRIWEKLVHADSDSWVWHGTRTPQGYGVTTFGRERRTTVHRLMFQTFKGEIGGGLVIDHLRRNRACCNPEHLEAVTNAENLRRGEGGGVVRAIAAARAAQTHCLRGHPLSGGNLRASKKGNRMCRRCANDLNNERRKKVRREAAALA